MLSAQTGAVYSEEDLKNIILKNIKNILGNSDDVKNKVKEKIKITLFKNDELNPKVINRKIYNHQKEIQILKCILKETEEKEYYVDKIKKLQHEIEKLGKLNTQVSEDGENTMYNEIFTTTETVMGDYFDSLVRNIIKEIIINISSMEIKYY